MCNPQFVEASILSSQMHQQHKMFPRVFRHKMHYFRRVSSQLEEWRLRSAGVASRIGTASFSSKSEMYRRGALTSMSISRRDESSRAARCRSMVVVSSMTRWRVENWDCDCARLVSVNGGGMVTEKASIGQKAREKKKWWQPPKPLSKIYFHPKKCKVQNWGRMFCRRQRDPQLFGWMAMDLDTVQTGKLRVTPVRVDAKENGRR